MPNVLIEAMFCGCTPVSTKCPTGPEEILKNEKNGYLCPVDDPSAMAGKLEQALLDSIPTEMLYEEIFDFKKKFSTGTTNYYLQI